MWEDILANMDFEKLAVHLRKIGMLQNISITKEKVKEKFKANPYIGLLFFTMWNFVSRFF